MIESNLNDILKICRLTGIEAIQYDVQASLKREIQRKKFTKSEKQKEFDWTKHFEQAGVSEVLKDHVIEDC